METPLLVLTPKSGRTSVGQLAVNSIRCCARGHNREWLKANSGVRNRKSKRPLSKRAITARRGVRKARDARLLRGNHRHHECRDRLDCEAPVRVSRSQ